MHVTLVVRVLNEENEIIAAYRQRENLSFVPTCGMKFKLSSSKPLWMTADGDEIAPPVKDIVYNIDDHEIYCLFEIDKLLSSNYWEKISNLDKSADLKQFEIHTQSKSMPAETKSAAVPEPAHNGVRQRIITLVYLLTPLSILGGVILSEILSEV